MVQNALFAGIPGSPPALAQRLAQGSGGSPGVQPSIPAICLRCRRPRPRGSSGRPLVSNRKKSPVRKRLLLKLKFSFVTAQSGPVPIASSEERRALSGEGWKLLSLLRTALQNSICSGKDCPCSQTGRGGHTGSWSCLSFPPTEQLCGHPPPMGLLVASVQIPFPQLVRRSSLFPAHQAHFKNSFLLCFSRCLLAHLAAALSWAEYLREGWEVVLWAWRGFLFFFFSFLYILFIFWAGLLPWVWAICIWQASVFLTGNISPSLWAALQHDLLRAKK